MHVISINPFKEAAIEYPNQRLAIMGLYRILARSKTRFETPEEMRKVFATLDNFKYKDKWYVLDVGGNNIRVIAEILFKSNMMYIKHIVNHTEYDKLCKRYRRG